MADEKDRKKTEQEPAEQQADKIAAGQIAPAYAAPRRRSIPGPVYTLPNSGRGNPGVQGLCSGRIRKESRDRRGDQSRPRSGMGPGLEKDARGLGQKAARAERRSAAIRSPSAWVRRGSRMDVSDPRP